MSDGRAQTAPIGIALPVLAATAALAAAIAPLVEERDVVELEGELGAGKTAFVAALAAALGCDERVRSPTYTVAHDYLLSGGRRLAHLDLYRQRGGMDEAAWGDVEPSVEGAIACIEWPGASRDWWAGRATWGIGLEHAGGERRVAWIVPPVARRVPARDQLVACVGAGTFSQCEQ